MGAGLLRRYCWALPPCKSAHHFCVAPKRRLPRLGRMRLAEPHLKTRWSPELFQGVPAAA